MQKTRAMQMQGILLAIGVCLAFLIGLMLPVHAADTTTLTGDCSHGYVTDIAIKPASTAKTFIPDYTFDSKTTSYEIKLYNSTTPSLLLSVDANAAKNNDLYYLIKWNGQPTLPTKAVKQIKASKTVDLPNVLTDVVKASCRTHELTVQVGKKDGAGLKDYDEYVFSVSFLPAMTDDFLKIEDNGTSIALTPQYTKGACYFGNNFAATASGESVTLTGKFRNADGKTSCYIGDSGTPVSGTNSGGSTSISEEITLSDYATSTSGMSKIPLQLVYNGDTSLTTVNYIYVMNEELAKPTITQQPQSVICDKLDTPTLSVAAAVPDGATSSYQWYTGPNATVVSPIANATDSTYTVPKEDTSLAGTRYYRCDVTSNITIDGVGTLQFTTQSEIASVETRLSFISKPTILMELGSFVSTRDEKFADIYRTEYNSGEKFDLAYISVRKPEAGVRLSYEYYCNTEPDFDTAQPIDFVFGQGWEVTTPDGNTHIITSAQPREGYEKGEYYIYCKVTASAKELASASTISGPLHLTYSDIVLEGFKGSGTKADPYQISSEADLAHLRDIVFNGQWCSGVQFKLMNNIELSADWTPIGDKNPALYNETTGRDIQAFSGVLNGNGKKITVATGGYPLFNYVSDAVIENLDIYGEQINGNGLIDKMFADYGSDGNYWTGVPNCVTIRNVRLLEGSSTLMSGFMLGSGSGANTITIENCVVQKGVTIGYDKQQNGIGSFVGGAFNGEINNSYSEADVYGVQRIGGLAASKGQSMGLCQIVNSHFSGNLVATGDWVGGLIAKGYSDPSAPNTMAVSFINSYVDGSITGADYVGGLFGGEGGLKGCINDCWLRDSHFYGTINATGDHVGGIIGWMESVNNCQHIENNYYYETSGKTYPLIGGVGHYWYTDEEKAVVIAKMGSAKTKKEFADGTVKNLLNAGSDYENWVQADGEAYPRLSGDAVVSSLTISGSYKTRYKQGEALDLDGIVFTAVWSDGKTENPTLDDVQQVTKFDPQHLGQQTITFRYGAGRASITVSVIKEYTDDDRENFGKANVTFTLTNNAYLQLANAPITVTYFDLANYGLEEYYQYDESGNVIEQPTMLHLFIAAMEHYEIGLEGDEIGKGSLRQYPNFLTVSGGSGHMYMTRFWNHDANLIYSLNGVYPLQSPGLGATADQLILHDGDFVDVAMFSDTTFYSDRESGMHYFSTDGQTPQRVFTITHDTDLKLTYLLAHTAMMGDYVTRFTPVKSQTTVYYGTSINGSDMKTMTTDKNSELTISFKDPGTYYLWTQGATGSNGKAIVSAPACATIIVTLNQEEINRKLVEDVEALIDAIDEVTEDSGDDIAAAREAYDALPEELKGSVTNYEDLVNAEKAYQTILNKKAAAQVDALIEAIGEVTEDSGDAIKAARDAYNALTDEQKEFVENYDKLEKAEVKYVEALIDAIGVVTKDSGEKIKAARDAYNALTPAQRKLVGNYKTLLAAEKRYEDLTKPVTPVTPSKPSKPKDDTAKPDASKFVDVSKNNWYFDAVQYVLENGLMNGMSANEFSPNANTTRGMIVTILARLDGVDTSGSSPWYAAGRTWAMNNGISDGTNMEGKITREQLAAMLYRYAKLKGYDVSASADISGYTDASGVSSWATDAMRWAVGTGLINGRTATTLAPQGNATRAEVAAILMRFAQKIVK